MGYSITLNVNEDEGIAKMFCITCQYDLFEVEVEGTITKWSKDHKIIGDGVTKLTDSFPELMGSVKLNVGFEWGVYLT